MDSKYDEPPSAKALDEGYNQTYLIMAKDEHSAEDIGHEVLFRCGNWCYKGLVQFNELRINLEDVPVVIPTLQRQQGSLRYYCTAKSIPASSEFFGPMGFMEEALEFVAQELTSEAVEKELIKMSAVFPWIEDDAAATYFELAVNELPACMEKVRLVASKTYTRGLVSHPHTLYIPYTCPHSMVLTANACYLQVLIAIYHNSHVYVILQAGEGEQPLLDVRFPDVSKHNQGILVNSYSSGDYRKLTLWHNTSSAVASGGAASALGNAVRKDLPKLKTINLSSANYEQTYVILHSSMDAATSSLSSYHDVLFRFGSWCYAGRVQLTPSLALYDIPYVIPALRMQQSRLDYVSDVAALPITSPFAAVLEYLRSVQEALESVLLGAEDAIAAAVATSSEEGAFFEFSLSLPAELRSRLSNVEMVVSKVYHPSGLVAISVFYQSAVYVTLQDSSKGEHPLLDSRFPMLQANRDRDEPQGLSCPSSDEDAASRPPTSVGYVLKHFEAGVPSWRELRKLTLWLSPDEPASNVSHPLPTPAAPLCRTVVLIISYDTH